MAVSWAAVSVSHEGFERVRKGNGKGCHRRCMLGIETEPIF